MLNKLDGEGFVCEGWLWGERFVMVFIFECEFFLKVIMDYGYLGFIWECVFY